MKWSHELIVQNPRFSNKRAGFFLESMTNKWLSVFRFSFYLMGRRSAWRLLKALLVQDAMSI